MVIDLDYSQLRSAVGLSDVTSDSLIKYDYLLSLNLGLFSLRKPRLLAFKSESFELKELFKVDNSMTLVILNGKSTHKTNYIRYLLSDGSRDPTTLDINNFVLSDSMNRIATVDLRVLFHDYTGKLSKGELFHINSVLTLMFGGIINYPIGINYVNDRLNKIGNVYSVYKERHSLYVALHDKKLVPKALSSMSTTSKVT
jgi:hypothetical protein